MTQDILINRTPFRAPSVPGCRLALRSLEPFVYTENAIRSFPTNPVIGSCDQVGGKSKHVDMTSNVALQRKKYWHSFGRPEKLIFIITNLNILYIILLSPKFWTSIYKIRQYWATYRLRFVARNLRANVKMSCPLLCKTP